MTARKTVLACSLLGVVLTGAGGCVMLVDAINPDVFAQVGIDTASIVNPQGTIIVAFNNQTSSSTTFYAFAATDASDLTRGARNFSVEVDTKQTGNEVVKCPVGLVQPGTLSSSYSVDTVAATVHETSGDVTVSYTGPALISGVAFQCGDLIAVELRNTAGTGETASYVITVRVIPGR